MSQFSGPQPGYKDTTRSKGVMRARRAQKRLEAEVRDELLPPNDPKRRAIRLGNETLIIEKPRRRQRTRKNAVVQVCVCCNVVMGEPHEDYCVIITGKLPEKKLIYNRNAGFPAIAL